MKTKSIVWGVVGVAVVVLAGGAEWAREIGHYEPLTLLACADEGQPIRSWLCKNSLTGDKITPVVVAELNKEAGALQSVSLKNSALAEESLAMFISHGVDVNATSEMSKDRPTALHIMVSDGNVDRVKLLLKNGADPSVNNAEGVSALDYARQFAAKEPTNPVRAEIVKVLEVASTQPQ